MGCLKISYNKSQEPSPFLCVWKKEGQDNFEKRHFLDVKAYEYHLKDHLGNVRVTVNENGDVVQRDDFMPFGLRFQSWKSGDENNFLFNQGFGELTFQGEPGVTFGTERIPELGWDMTKYRTYDYTIGRFIQVDPLADSLTQWTPYNYGFNNPIRYNDPNGDCPTCLLGGIIGAVVELGTQVAVNAATGKDLTDIDFADVGVAAVAGALTSGVGSIAKLGAAGARVAKAVQSTSKVAKAVKTAATEGTKSAVDAKATKDGISVTAVGAGKNLSEAGVDLATGVISTPIGGSITREATGAAQKAVGKTVEAGLEAMTKLPGESVKEIIKDEN